MRRLSKKIVFLFSSVFFLYNYPAQAQLKITAVASAATVGKAESFEYKLLVENADQVEQITPPVFSDFIIISGPNQESGMESINGHTRQYVGITYILQPKKKGSFTLPAARAKADGKMLVSNAVAVKVTNAPSQNNQQAVQSPLSQLFQIDEPAAEPQFNDFILKKGENIADKINKNIFIKTATSSTSCYVGEPVVVTYKLYTRLKSESNIVKNPSLNGFSVIDLMQQGNISAAPEKLNGRLYNVYILRKAQLYPLQAGDAELETAEVENNIHFIKEEYLHQRSLSDDMLQGFARPALPPETMVNEKVTLQSKPVIIAVKPLPDAGRPLSFTGAVGNFSVNQQVEKNSFSTDDAGKLTITIKGNGNLTLLTPPDISWPEGIEGFEPAVKEDLNKYTIPVSGSKSVSYPFMVSKAGSYILPPVEFSYFDIAAGKYKIAHTLPVTITVTKGTNKKPALQNILTGKTKREIFFDTFFSNRWLIIVPVGLFIFTGLLFWLKRERKKEMTYHKKLAGNLLKNKPADNGSENNTQIKIHPLAGSEAKLLQQDTQGFYEVLSKEINNCLAKKFNLSPYEINRKNIMDALDKAPVSYAEGRQVQQLLDDVDYQLYTPFADSGKMEEIYYRAVAALHALNSTST